MTGKYQRRWSWTHVVFIAVCFVSTTIFSDLSTVKADDDFDSFLDSLDSMAGSLMGALGDVDGCEFQCINGGNPKPNPKHKPRSNGCGSFGLQLDTSAVPAVTDCCHTHDYCYDTCNKDKNKCDEAFKKCLRKVCDKLKSVFGKDVHEGCYATADLMYASTLALGCKPYKESQKVACICKHDEL